MKENHFALYIPGVHVGGTDFVFLSGTRMWQSGYQVEHAICSIGTMSSTLDLVEPIVDSSPFSVELALDASNASNTVRTIFSRDPVKLGTLASSYTPTTTSMRIICSAALASQTICIGPASYNYTHSSFSSSVDVGTVTAHGVISSAQAQLGFQFYDDDLKIGPDVTMYPARWKGRLAYLYLQNDYFSPSWLLYRAGYIADNPHFGLQTLTLSIAPLDCKLRDHNVSSTKSTPMHFARTYSRSYLPSPLKSAYPALFGEGYLDRGVSLPVSITSGGEVTLTSGSATYSQLYSSLQPVITTPSGACLFPTVTDDFATPQRPPFLWLNSQSYSEPKFLGRSGSTAYINLTPSQTSLPTAIQVLPTWRWYLTAPTAPSYRIGSIFTRTQSRVQTPSTSANAEPIARIGTNTTAIAWPMHSLSVSTTYAATGTPSQGWFGLLWMETAEKDDYNIRQLGLMSTFLDFFRSSVPDMPGYAVSCADSTLGWDALTATCDCYSMKLVSATRTIQAAEYNVTGGRGDTRIGVCLGLQPLATSEVYSIAQATDFWLRGEDYITLNQQVGSATQKLWLNVTWTEDADGAVEHQRRMRVQYDSYQASGVYRYKVLKQPKHCPGIGDWFGHRATFEIDTTISGESDGDLFSMYLLGDNSMQGSLWLSSYQVDAMSLYQFPLTTPLVSEWIFADAEAFDDNFASMLSMSTSAMSFSVVGGYKVCRVATGRALRSASAVAVSDDTIIDLPTASRDENIVSDYTLTMPEPYGSITYSDAAAKMLYSSTSSIEVDLSQCEVAQLGSSSEVVQAMAGTLANMVSILGYDRRQWSFSVPFEVGWSLAPGMLVTLTTSYTIGADATPPPSSTMCRVLDVEQDVVGQTTALRVIPVQSGGAPYQRGCVVLDWDVANLKYTVDDASWISAGMTLYYANGLTVTVASVSNNTFTISGSFEYTTGFWRAAEANRFYTNSDSLS